MSQVPALAPEEAEVLVTRILEQELANEEQLLNQAKKELAEQESTRLGNERNYQRVLERLEPYKKKVALHESNIANLRKEMSSLR